MQKGMVNVPLFLCIAAIGCYATAAQVILIREFLSVFCGNELCLGIIFGAWFLGIAAGAFTGARVEHILKHTFRVFIVILFVMCFILPVQVFSARSIRGFLGVGIGEYVSVLPLSLTSVGLIFPFSFLIGFIFPFSSKIFLGTTRDAAVDVGVVYIVESMGSLIGGLVFSFFLVSRCHPFRIIVLLNIGMLVLLTLSLTYFQEKQKVSFRREVNKRAENGPAIIPLCFALSMIVIWFSSIPDKIHALSTKMRWDTLNPNIELVASTDSKYQHIDIGRQAEQYSVYLNGQYAAAFPNEYEYAQVAHLVMTQHPSPKRVLLIGSGLGGFISEMLLYPVETLDYVELDEKLLHTTYKYLSSSDTQALSDRRVNIVHQDGRYYIKNTSKKHSYDIVLVNIPDPSTAFLNRFYTLEFFQEVQTILKPDGILATAVSSAVTYVGKDVGSYTGSLYRTLHEAFRYVLVTPGQTNFYFVCNQEGIITLDIETLMGRYKKQQIKSDYFTEYLFYTLLPPEQVEFIETQLGQRKDLIVNTDVRPVTYFLNLVLWDSLTGGRLHGLFRSLKDVGLGSFIVSILIALAGRILYGIVRQFTSRPKVDRDKMNSRYPVKSSPSGKSSKVSYPSIHDILLGEGSCGGRSAKFIKIQPGFMEKINHYPVKQLKINCLVALAITGFTGIALEIVLLYAFQNIYGYIYERMGVIVAVFMVGLALGGYIANRIIQKHNLKWVNVLMVFQGIIGFCAFLLPFAIHALSFYSIAAEIGLVCFIGIAGILTGLEFPLMNKILMQFDQDIAVSAGATNGADHIGAFLGAIVTGVVFLPLLGIFGTCLILAILNISSLILIAFSVFLFRIKKTR